MAATGACGHARLMGRCAAVIAFVAFPIAAAPLAADETRPIPGVSLLGVCNTAERCLLHQDPDTKAYVCRPPADHCEASFLDGGCSAHACERAAGCEFVPGQCFCPSGVQCICGGGPPPVCRLADER